MKIAHEAPLSLMEEVQKETDYDYALVHLFEDPEIGQKYFQYFKDSLSKGRTVILDNSIFELGRSFDPSRFYYWIKKLNPTEYIIPDVLEDSEGTMRQLDEWLKMYPSAPGKKIGVVQGKTYEDIRRCYLEVDRYCDKIAISFDYSLYTSLFSHQNKVVSWCFGRIRLINMLLRDDIINWDKPHHLLGCSIPEEFKYYDGYDFIESMDSSNPVVHGLLGIKYPERGLLTKNSIKVVDLLHKEPNFEEIELIKYNISQFRKLIKG